MRKYDTILALLLSLMLTAGPAGCVAGGTAGQQPEGNASLRVLDANGRTASPAYWLPISGPDLPTGSTLLASCERATPPWAQKKDRPAGEQAGP